MDSASGRRISSGASQDRATTATAQCGDLGLSQLISVLQSHLSKDQPSLREIRFVLSRLEELEPSFARQKLVREIRNRIHSAFANALEQVSRQLINENPQDILNNAVSAITSSSEFKSLFVALKRDVQDATMKGPQLENVQEEGEGVFVLRMSNHSSDVLDIEDSDGGLSCFSMSSIPTIDEILHNVQIIAGSASLPEKHSSMKELLEYSASDLVCSQHWSLMLQTFKDGLGSEDDYISNSSLALFSRIFKSCAAGQTVEVYLALLDHVNLFCENPNELSIKAPALELSLLARKIRLLVQFQAEVATYCVTLSSHLMTKMLQDAFKFLCKIYSNDSNPRLAQTAVIYASVDPNASWLNAWIRNGMLRHLAVAQLFQCGFLSILSKFARGTEQLLCNQTHQPKLPVEWQIDPAYCLVASCLSILGCLIPYIKDEFLSREVGIDAFQETYQGLLSWFLPLLVRILCDDGNWPRSNRYKTLVESAKTGLEAFIWIDSSHASLFVEDPMAAVFLGKLQSLPSELESSPSNSLGFARLVAHHNGISSVLSSIFKQLDFGRLITKVSEMTTELAIAVCKISSGPFPESLTEKYTLVAAILVNNATLFPSLRPHIPIKRSPASLISSVCSTPLGSLWIQANGLVGVCVEQLAKELETGTVAPHVIYRLALLSSSKSGFQAIMKSSIPTQFLRLLWFLIEEDKLVTDLYAEPGSESSDFAHFMQLSQVLFGSCYSSMLWTFSGVMEIQQLYPSVFCSSQEAKYRPLLQTQDVEHLLLLLVGMLFSHLCNQDKLQTQTMFLDRLCSSQLNHEEGTEQTPIVDACSRIRSRIIVDCYFIGGPQEKKRAPLTAESSFPIVCALPPPSLYLGTGKKVAQHLLSSVEIGLLDEWKKSKPTLQYLWSLARIFVEPNTPVLLDEPFCWCAAIHLFGLQLPNTAPLGPTISHGPKPSQWAMDTITRYARSVLPAAHSFQSEFTQVIEQAIPILYTTNLYDWKMGSGELASDAKHNDLIYIADGNQLFTLTRVSDEDWIAGDYFVATILMMLQPFGSNAVLETRLFLTRYAAQPFSILTWPLRAYSHKDSVVHHMSSLVHRIIEAERPVVLAILQKSGLSICSVVGRWWEQSFWDILDFADVVWILLARLLRGADWFVYISAQLLIDMEPKLRRAYESHSVFELCMRGALVGTSIRDRLAELEGLQTVYRKMCLGCITGLFEDILQR